MSWLNPNRDDTPEPRPVRGLFERWSHFADRVVAWRKRESEREERLEERSAQKEARQEAKDRAAKKRHEQEEQHEKEQRARLEEAKALQAALEQPLRDAWAPTLPDPSSNDDPARRLLGLTEVFSPPLERDQPYAIAIRGVVEFEFVPRGKRNQQAEVSTLLLRADPLYSASPPDWFPQRGSLLLFNLHRVPGRAVLIEDREDHRYVFEWLGTGEKLGVSLRPPDHFRSLELRRCSGSMEIFAAPIVLPPDPLPLPPPPPAVPEPASLLVDENLLGRLRRLVAHYTLFRDLGAEEYLKKFAAKHGQKLISQGPEIEEQAVQFLSDPQLHDLLRAQHPEVADEIIRFTTRDARALVMARFMDVEPPAPPPVPLPPAKPAPRRKLTPEQYRERLLRRKKVKTDDELALLEADIERRAKQRAAVEAAKKRDDLTEEEAEDLTRRISEPPDPEGDQNENARTF